MCDWSNPCFLAIKVKASAIHLPTDFYILTIYLPPEYSSYLKSTNTDPFLLLGQAFTKIPPNAPTILMGDLNAHTNHQSGSLPNVHPDILPQFSVDSQSVDPPHRQSLDHHTVDNYGRLLLKFSRDRDLTILNGCPQVTPRVNFTYEVGNTRSVIDYSIVSQSLWPYI